MSDTGFKLRVHLAPIRDESYGYRSSNLLGQYAGSFNEAHGESDGVELDSGIVSFDPDTPGTIENELLDGTGRVNRVSMPRRNLVIDVSGLDADQWARLDRLLATGRPLAVGAWFDESTRFMSHFAGLDNFFKGVAEIGRCTNSQVIRRDQQYGDALSDLWPHDIGGYNTMRGSVYDADGNVIPKIVRGMIGNAILLESPAWNAYGSSTPSVGSSLWPNNSGAGHADVRAEATFYRPLAGGGYVTHIAIGCDSAGERYVESGNVSLPDTSSVGGVGYCPAILARGSGTFRLQWINAGTVDNAETFVLTDKVQLFPLYNCGGNPGDTRRLRISAGGSVGTSAVHMEFFGRMLVPGQLIPTAWPRAGTAPSPVVVDGITVDDSAPWAGYTVVVWFRWNLQDMQNALYAVEGLGFVHWLYWRGYDLFFEHQGGSEDEVTDAFLNIEENSWVQVVMTSEAPTTSPYWYKRKFYVNGVLKATSQQAVDTTALVASGAQSFKIGHGGSQPWWAANAPIDAFRLDARIWGAAEVAKDWETRSDTGMQTILQKLQGRYFALSHDMSPQAVFIDKMRGIIRLRQVDIRLQSAT
jgi:hypothetical protein